MFLFRSSRSFFLPRKIFVAKCKNLLFHFFFSPCTTIIAVAAVIIRYNMKVFHFFSTTHNSCFLFFLPVSGSSAVVCSAIFNIYLFTRKKKKTKEINDCEGSSFLIKFLTLCYDKKGFPLFLLLFFSTFRGGSLAQNHKPHPPNNSTHRNPPQKRIQTSPSSKEVEFFS